MDKIRLLIFGINGYTGRYLVKQLIKSKKHIIFGADIHKKALLEEEINLYYKIDISNYEDVYKLISLLEPDQIINLAGINNNDNSQMFSVNYQGVFNILESVKNYNCNISMLFVGSSAEYGIVSEGDSPISEDYVCNPISFYGITKYAATISIKHYVRNFNLKAVIARPFNIIGGTVPDNLFVGALIKRIKHRILSNSIEPVTVGNVQTFRDFVDVKDVVESYIFLINSNFWGEIFNICSGIPTQILYILNTVISFSDRNITYIIDPELVRADDVLKIYGSNQKLYQFTGFKPSISLVESLKTTWNSNLTIHEL